MVTLTAAVIGDSIFSGWSGGGCGGTGTCMVTTDSAVLVTATFTLNQHTLNVATNGTGTGMVSSVPGGIACPGDCMEDYDSGTSVELTATPIEGRFAGWSGNCSGTGACTTVLGVDRSVTATFTLITIGNVNSTSGNGIYTAPATIPIQITFSDAVTVTGTPTLALNSGGVATYGGGSFTNTLTFNYVVATGHASADLDYTATDALSLNGGTIQDALGNNATLALPAPGAADSLGATKAIVIDAVTPVVSAITGPAMYDDDAFATLTYSVSEVHPGSTNCTFTMGTGNVNTCTTTGATVNSLDEGLHILSVTHTDTAGNVSVAQTYSWTVDTIDPVVSVISGPASPSDSTSATLTYSVTDVNPSSTNCAQTAGTGTPTGCTNTMATYTTLSTGSHTVSVTHTDLAGNASTAKTYVWSVCPAQTFTFTAPTTGTDFTVPATCGTLEIYAWGGGGGHYATVSAFGNGGGGGFAGGTIAASASQVLSIAVGGGGAVGTPAGAGGAGGAGGTNGGGDGGTGFNLATEGGGGGGGGWSGVYAGATRYVIAAGGGGGPAGGGGGGLSGGTGGGSSGGGGSQSAGGVPGSGGDAPAGAGTALQGGVGAGLFCCDGAGGGGGGGGLFGGGGGGYSSGGGGGSSVTHASVAGGNTVAGSGAGPGNTASPYYLAPYGAGAVLSGSGNPGLW